MQDLSSRDGGFRETLCGNGGNQEGNDGSGGGSPVNGSAGWQQAPLGVLAGVCGYANWPNGTFDLPPGTNPIDYYLNMTQNLNMGGNDNDEENDKKSADEKSCSVLASEYGKYNVSGGKGECYM